MGACPVRFAGVTSSRDPCSTRLPSARGADFRTHPVDVRKLLESPGSLVDRGHPVVAIIHKPSLMLFAEWVIDMSFQHSHRADERIHQPATSRVESACSTCSKTCSTIPGNLVNPCDSCRMWNCPNAGNRSSCGESEC
jgi:hypothetical protein